MIKGGLPLLKKACLPPEGGGGRLKFAPFFRMPPNIYNLFLAPNFMVITPKLRSFAPNYLIKMPLNKYLRFPIHKFAKTEKAPQKKFAPTTKI